MPCRYWLGQRDTLKLSLYVAFGEGPNYMDLLYAILPYISIIGYFQGLNLWPPDYMIANLPVAFDGQIYEIYI